MRLGKDWQLWTVCVALAAGSAAGVLTFDPLGDPLDPTQIEQTDVVPTAPSPSIVVAKRSDRLPMAYVEPEPHITLQAAIQDPPSAFAGDVSAPVEDHQQTGTAEQENPDWWPADVKVNAPPPKAGPKLAKALPASLPWQTRAPVGAGQDHRLIERLAEISPTAKKRLIEKFETAKAAWPPSDMALVAIKDEKVVELLARSAGGTWKMIHRYPVLAASGTIGPKLRQGDMQVPEGVYGISFLNPDSRYHVSLRVNYPNSFDRQMAEKDGRKNLGGDIMIHGKNVSKGCLALGDAAAEEVFVLAAQIGISNVKVVIAPTDLRRQAMPDRAPGQPVWVPKLYTEVASAMSEFPKPPNTGLLSFFGK